MQKHIKQNISDRTTIPNSQMVNSVSNNLKSVDQAGFKRSQKSFFTTNEDFTNSNSRLSKMMNQIQYLGSDCEEEPHARPDSRPELTDSGGPPAEGTLGSPVVIPEEAHLDHDFENLDNHFDLNLQNEACESQHSQEEQPEEDQISQDDQRFADTMNQFSKLVNSVHNEYFHEPSSEDQYVNSGQHGPIEFEEVATDFETINNYYNTDNNPTRQDISGMLDYRKIYCQSNEDNPQNAESGSICYSKSKSDNSVVIICEKELPLPEGDPRGRTSGSMAQRRLGDSGDESVEHALQGRQEVVGDAFNYPRKREESNRRSSEICCNLVKNLSEVLLKVDEEEQAPGLSLSNDLKKILSPETETLYADMRERSQSGYRMSRRNEEQAEREREAQYEMKATTMASESENQRLREIQQTPLKPQNQEEEAQKGLSKKSGEFEKNQRQKYEAETRAQDMPTKTPLADESLEEISKRISEYHSELSRKLGLDIQSNTSFIKNKREKKTTSKVIFKIWKKYNYENRWGTQVKVQNKGQTMEELDQLAPDHKSPEKTKIRFSIPEKEIFSLVAGMHSSLSPEGKIDLDSKSLIKMTESMLREKIIVQAEPETSENRRPPNRVGQSLANL